MYHSIPRTAESADYYAVPRATFAAQLDRLRAFGLGGTSVESALDDDDSGRARRPLIAISFDDGNADNFTEAFPELLARGMTATFFVITSRVGTPGYVTWEQLEEMRGAGMSIQSHTHTHPFLSELSSSEAYAELEESRRMLDTMLGQSTTTLALPNGDRPRGWTAHDFAAAGFRWVATSAFGPNNAPWWSVRRYTVRRETTFARFDELARTLPSAISPEGLRLRALRVVRSVLGVPRYASWRRRVLSATGR